MEWSDSEQESIIFPQNSHIKADLSKQNISVPERRKRMFKSHPPYFDQAIKMCRRTTLTEKQLKDLCDEKVNLFTDEYSYQSSEEIDEEEQQKNATSLKSIF